MDSQLDEKDEEINVLQIEVNELKNHNLALQKQIQNSNFAREK